MSQEWGDRQRQTNRLVRRIARYVLDAPKVNAQQLYGLCKLTWITNSFDGANAAYIESTKIPALGCALSRDYSGWSLTDVADDVATVLGTDEIKSLILSHTGFTNFYKPYRNSCLKWIKDNREEIESLFRRAYALATDVEGLEIIKGVDRLPGIPKANVVGSLMKAEYLLTPALFALDSRLRFPLINGNKGVKAVLAAIGAAHSPLAEQYTRMVELYGHGGIRDAADLDQAGHDLPDFIKVGAKFPTKKLLEKKPVEGNVLPAKEEQDIEVLLQARTVARRRLHNVLTNTLRDLLISFTLLEGCHSSALFDVLVKGFKGGDEDLLIEAKSSVDEAQIRMAVGQLFDYWFHIKGPIAPHLAVLTPERPSPSTIDMLCWLKIGVLWVEDGSLHTATDWLNVLVK